MNEKVTSIPELFGSMVFTQEQMRQRLPARVYNAWQQCLVQGTSLDRSIADEIASAMKDWAIEKGATHYTHWFQPMTGFTAEKHDGFITPHGPTGVLMELSGKELSRGEADASSFPSGGLRATFEARGYTAWDPTAYAFVKDKTLYIPTIFCSYGGETLDKKTPLLRSMKLLDTQSIRILRLFGNTQAQHVTAQVGPEQEYFLIDKEMYRRREDLVLCGRTLFGAKPPKGQELDDHYYGAIKPRVAEFMHELDQELWKVGVPAKTEHNEVAPAQHEVAQVYSDANSSCDHNQLTMEFLKKVADRHGLVCLLHEKPFAGINGSGKHCNWSLSTDTGVLLHAPGKTPESTLRFVTFIVETLMGVYRHNGLLKASIMSATNAHRLGANEAPPAIISSFLGKQLSELLDHIEQSDSEDDFIMAGKQGLKMDIPEIPELMIDNTDRNRTSPFAFTGNRFEFRAVGSEANCASSMIALNSAVAEALTDFKARVDALIAQGEDRMKAIVSVLREDITACKPIRFDGNGYSEEWVEEARRRGLDCETSCPVIFDNYLSESSVRMFTSLGVMTRKELEARNEVKWETYTKKIQIEARVMGDLTMNHIIPVATHYQSMLLKNVQSMRAVFPAEKAEKLSSRNMKIIEDIAERTQAIEQGVEELVNARKVANRIADEREKAVAYHDTVVPKMEAIRYHIDKLELCVSDELWTQPKYRELLFIR